MPLLGNNIELVNAVEEDTYIRTTYSSNYDGTLKEDGANYIAVRTATVADKYDTVNTMAVGQDLVAGTYYVMRSYLPFDTSPIPDNSQIDNATLNFYMEANFTDTDFNVTIQTGSPPYPHIPLQTGDYNYLKYSGDGGQFNTSLLAAGYNTINFTSTGLTWISKTGYTKLVLRSSKDIAGTAPTGLESFSFWAREKGSAYAPYLTVGYTCNGTSYILHGAFAETGLRDGAITTTFYKVSESPETFSLDGNYTVYAEQHGSAFHFDLGNNESRVIYCNENMTAEEFYVFKPTDPYYTYYFKVVDFIGVDWGYLETLINVNGTDQIVERWDTQIYGELPFTLSWGRAYKIRLVSSAGVYYYSDFMAGATLEATFPITSDMFPPSATDTGDITVTGTRQSATWIQGTYSDGAGLTVWINMSIYVSGSSTAVVSTLVTANSLTYNWYEAEEDSSYYLRILAYHETRGQIEYTFPCVAPFSDTNPFAALDDVLGEGLPFQASQAVGLFLVLLMVGGFSRWNADVGLVVGVLMAALLTYLAILNMSWEWLIGTMEIAILIALSIRKSKEPSR